MNVKQSDGLSRQHTQRLLRKSEEIIALDRMAYWRICSVAAAMRPEDVRAKITKGYAEATNA